MLVSVRRVLRPQHQVGPRRAAVLDPPGQHHRLPHVVVQHLLGAALEVQRRDRAGRPGSPRSSRCGRRGRRARGAHRAAGRRRGRRPATATTTGTTTRAPVGRRRPGRRPRTAHGGGEPGPGDRDHEGHQRRSAERGEPPQRRVGLAEREPAPREPAERQPVTQRLLQHPRRADPQRRTRAAAASTGSTAPSTAKNAANASARISHGTGPT